MPDDEVRVQQGLCSICGRVIPTYDSPGRPGGEVGMVSIEYRRQRWSQRNICRVCIDVLKDVVGSTIRQMRP